MKHQVLSDEQIREIISTALPLLARTVEMKTIEAVVEINAEACRGSQDENGVGVRESLVKSSYEYHAITRCVAYALDYGHKVHVQNLIETLDSILSVSGAGIHCDLRLMLAEAKRRLA